MESTRVALKTPESKRESHKRWRSRNIERVRAEERERYRKNRERYLLYSKTDSAKARRKELYLLNQKKHSARKKEFNDNLRRETFSSYGNACSCCGDKTFEFLTMDHIHGRKKQGHSNRVTGVALYRWLKARGFPKEGFRILCYNCNCSRGFLGYCPHERDKNKS